MVADINTRGVREQDIVEELATDSFARSLRGIRNAAFDTSFAPAERHQVRLRTATSVRGFEADERAAVVCQGASGEILSRRDGRK